MFRRGFKTWAERTAADLRAALHLAADAPVDPARLATHLGIPVLTPHELGDLAPDAALRLTSEHRDEWSAITVAAGPAALIVINPAHPVTRRNSSLAHEIAHIILGHEPSVIFLAPASGAVLRTHNREQEEEAAWLSGTLLLPRAAVLAIRQRRLTDDQACGLYAISPAMLQFRTNMTGVDRQLNRSRRASARRGL